MKKNCLQQTYLGFTAFIILVWFTLLSSCSSNQQQPLFELKQGSETGLNFVNKLTATPNFNMFKYMYFYNGAGVGAGDFNNDGKIDVFFASNQQQNKLYLNKGNLHFEDVTVAAKIPTNGGWSTGVSVIDINNDGLLDIYVCKVGNFDALQSHNEFLICKGIDANGVPFYEDEALQRNVAFSAFGTQTSFIDYDNDGDLDMYLMNHSLRYNGTFNARNTYYNTTDSLSADYLLQNNNGVFTDVSKQAGITGYIIGYGLGICISDIDMDGYQDIYIGNDFHENDYLYINQKNGTFKEVIQNCIMHTSQFSMGVDIADANNDGYPEIITMDMMPSDPYILKRSLDEDAYDLFQFKRSYGYMPQFAKNALQYNRGNGMFSEVGMYSKVFATDWSWAALFTDFDNDGWKDLFISNGIPKRLNDIDYVNYVSDAAFQDKIRSNNMGEKDMALIDKFPQIKLPNRFYLNKKNLQFEDVDALIKNNTATYSNGAAYADFDNDGDIDIVVNNIDDAAMLYQNKTNDHATNHWLSIQLRGDSNNYNAIGTKVLVYSQQQLQTYETTPVRGFQSAMQVPVHIGLGSFTPDSVLVVWPNHTYQKINNATDTTITITYKKGLPVFNYQQLKQPLLSNKIVDITNATQLRYVHEENPFNEFNREQLMPHMVSREGPALAIGDYNGDGLEDVFIGAAKAKKAGLFLQTITGTFKQDKQPNIENDSTYEDVAAQWVDVNNDRSLDLVVASGGNEYYGNSEFLLPRVYINDGKGHLTKNPTAFDNAIMLTASCVTTLDINNDGFVDLFFGGRAVPWQYGVVPSSYLLLNDGKGNFKNVTKNVAPYLSDVGFVTSAITNDIDKNGLQDLVLTLEWGGIIAFTQNQQHQFTAKWLTQNKGWWNFIKAVDVDGDGDDDFIAGNLGLNNRLYASPSTPVNMYYNDFDGNGKKEQIVTYFLQNKQIPFANKDELQKQLPSFKKQYLYAADFAKANLFDLFPKASFDNALKYEANDFSNVVLINQGNGKFDVKPLPWQAQLAPYKDAAIVDANNDHLPDIFLIGNYYHNNIQMGMHDADYGSLLINQGKGNFKYETLNGVVLRGESRHIAPITIQHKQAYIIAKNNDSALVLQFQQ